MGRLSVLEMGWGTLSRAPYWECRRRTAHLVNPFPLCLFPYLYSMSLYLCLCLCPCLPALSLTCLSKIYPCLYPIHVSVSVLVFVSVSVPGILIISCLSMSLSLFLSLYMSSSMSSRAPRTIAGPEILFTFAGSGSTGVFSCRRNSYRRDINPFTSFPERWRI